jgi:hypothetical protein
MRRFDVCLAFAALALTGCNPDSGLQNIAQECRTEQASALVAEYPNADLVAQHDQLEQKAAALNQQAQHAVQNTGNPDAGMADIDQSVQDSEDADGLYDYQERQQSANQCWQMLDEVAGDERAQWARLQQQNAADYAAAQARAAAQSQPDPAMTPPAPAAAEPIPNFSPPPQQTPKTYMDTPHAVIVPPALRTEPVGEGGPAVPPIAQ